MTPLYYVHPSAYVDEPCTIGAGTKIWHFCHVMAGARIGERCILGQNVHVATVGRYAFIGAGAVARGDVPDYALMLEVPAVQQGWMSRHGYRLGAPDAHGMRRCPESGWRYQEVAPGIPRCLDWPEDQPLP